MLCPVSYSNRPYIIAAYSAPLFPQRIYQVNGNKAKQTF